MSSFPYKERTSSLEGRSLGRGSLPLSSHSLMYMFLSRAMDLSGIKEGLVSLTC